MKYLLLIVVVFLLGCNSEKSHSEEKKSRPSHKYTFVEPDSTQINFIQTEYVPVYSDIYHRDGTRRFQLTTTLSIRNTSLIDSAYILEATYYDSYGKKLAAYIDSTILLTPLESIEFVVSDREIVGGAGANFIINWGGRIFSDQMFIQAVMISTYSQQGISFTTNSKVISKTTK